MTSADRAHRRRARRAIYGPPAAAVLGFALLAGGASGLVVHERSGSGKHIEPGLTSSSSSSSTPQTTTTTSR